MEGAEDLYGDLDNVKMEKSSSSNSKPKSTTTVALEKQIEELKARTMVSEKENETLKRNMGTLFRTARTEIERKDAEIASLTKQLNPSKNHR
mmetsp:Transcript_20862/g.34481  ORF Transcript_20862/g.34481 Transcript_20862/m.34481 type:complete len:92 (+) Transcript_20862:305-580(+)|eukprot:CAMPEP_0119020766 /NCGR_PEP_ID=MMETSP1176-20130426/24705_1 /TAXON_ID=265551 /ORGANISM="Synedropsis recta cf, Strain CCMP1620" /LENGTH=91 /DNA_ID=CAMNT_0006975245 /DNA_START=299 /DNA_END=574 /DNA_ORIENTATION=+